MKHRLLTAVTALLVLALYGGPAPAGDVTLGDDGTLVVTGTPDDGSSPWGFGNYNEFQAYPLNGHDHVDYWDQAMGYSHDFAPGAIKAIDATLEASGLYSVNMFYNALDVPATATATGDYVNLFMNEGSAHATFIAGPAVQNFFVVHHSDTVISDGNEYDWYID